MMNTALDLQFIKYGLRVQKPQCKLNSEKGSNFGTFASTPFPIKHTLGPKPAP